MKRGILHFGFVALLLGCDGASDTFETHTSPVAVLAITDSPTYDFGSQWVDSRILKVFTVTNVGTTKAAGLSGSFSLSLNFNFAGGAFPGEGGDCALDLGPAQSCRVVVEFHPRYVGNIEEVLKLSYFDGVHQQVTAAPTLKAKGTWDNPGNSDLTLASLGRIVFPVTPLDDTGRSISVQSDGKILMAGSLMTTSGKDFYIQRMLSDGSLDSTFGTSGRRVLGLGVGSHELKSLALSPEGKILLAGTSFQNGSYGLAVVRLLNDGREDTTWGGTGRVWTVLTGSNLIAGNALFLADRGILVVGSVDRGGQKDVALIRYLSDGSLDGTFGNLGVITTPVLAGDSEGTSLAVVENKILVGGRAGRDFLLLRYDWNGQLDPSFGGNGMTLLDLDQDSNDRAESLRVQNDGKVLLAGTSTGLKSDFAAARFSATGSLDAGFGSAGKVLISFGSEADTLSAMVIQSDKKILIGGTSGSDLGLVRLLASGAPDTLFGTQGKAVVSLGAGMDRLEGLALQSNGKILVIGESFDGLGFDPFLARVWP